MVNHVIYKLGQFYFFFYNLYDFYFLFLPYYTSLLLCGGSMVRADILALLPISSERHLIFHQEI